MVAVLAGNRHRASQALCRQSGDGATGGAVIRGDDRIDLVVVGGQELLHVLLRIGRQPAIGIGLANILDLASIDGFLQHFHLARKQEVGIRVSA